MKTIEIKTNLSGEELQVLMWELEAFCEGKRISNPVLRQAVVSGSLPSDDRIVAEAIQVARKVDTEVGLLPNNNDIKMFCLGAKWMRDLAKGNDR